MSRSMCTRASHGSGIRRWLVALMLLSLLGMADSGYLFWKHRRSTLLTTGTGGSNFCQAGGCDLVSQGKYAEVKGIPVAAFGIAGYLALLALSVMAAALGGGSVVGAIIAISGIGVGVSAYLVYLQVAVIGAICSWCVLSAFTMTSIFILSVLLVRKMRPLDLSEPAAQEGAI
ncbi:MAG: conserved rane protein of unknown function [candidate division NC10 bacterium]|nr:conserved rane protein of unknown function [candidate division NC10 bacterium]